MSNAAAILLPLLLAPALAGAAAGQGRDASGQDSTDAMFDNLAHRAAQQLPVQSTDNDMDSATLAKAAPASHFSVSAPSAKLNLKTGPAVQGASQLKLPFKGPSRDGLEQPNLPGQLGAALLAGVMLTAPMGDAEAARSGGRMGGGGGGFASRSAPSRVAPRATAPRAPSAPSTNVYVNPAPRTNVYVSPGFGGGMMGFGGMPGYGYGFGGGMTTGQYLGLSIFETLIREQQRQAYLQQQLKVQQQLGNDQAKIQQLQMELQAQNSKVDDLKAKAPPMDENTVKQLQQQLAEQQKQIEELKAQKAPAPAR